MSGSIRTAMAAICGVVGVVGLLLCLVAQWAEHVVFDEGEIPAAVDAALDDPEVITSLADRLAGAVVEAADLAGRLERRHVLARVVMAIGGSADRGSAAAEADIEDWLSERLEVALSDDRTQRALTAVVERAHRALLRVLEDDPVAPRLAVTDDAVTVNLLPLVVEGLGLVQRRGGLPGVDLPTLDIDDGPTVHREQLSAALGRDLPEGFAQLVVYRGEAVESAGAAMTIARDVAVLARRAALLIGTATVGSLAATIALARGRRRAAGWMTAGAAALFAIGALVVSRLVAEAPSALADPGAARAAAVIGSSLTSDLSAVLRAGAVVGAAAATLLLTPWRRIAPAEPAT